MKILSLNIWGGVIYNPLISFLEKNQDIDIFCFQEVLFGKEEGYLQQTKAKINIYCNIKKILKNHNSINAYDKNSDYFETELLVNIPFGQSIFFNKNIKILENGFFSCHGTYQNNYGGKVTGKCQWIKFNNNGQEIYLLNFHGLSQRETYKRDTPERLFQSQVLIEFMKNKNCILIGDFNLNPDTQSLLMLEGNLNNLIKQYDIKNTRSEIYKKPERYADYALISDNINVNNFEVMNEQVSDHLPLLLEI